jgi:hypothetical protein
MIRQHDRQHEVRRGMRADHLSGGRTYGEQAAEGGEIFLTEAALASFFHLALGFSPTLIVCLPDSSLTKVRILKNW